MQVKTIYHEVGTWRNKLEKYIKEYDHQCRRENKIYNIHDLYLDVLNRQSFWHKAVSAFYSEKDLRLIAHEENKKEITNY